MELLKFINLLWSLVYYLRPSRHFWIVVSYIITMSVRLHHHRRVQLSQEHGSIFATSEDCNIYVNSSRNPGKQE
jgi:hypothetical protein